MFVPGLWFCPGVHVMIPLVPTVIPAGALKKP